VEVDCMKMGDGTLVVVIDKDGDKSTASVWHNPGLDVRYRRLFRNAWRQARKVDRNKVDHGIKVVVFGSFWLEALVNRVLSRIVMRETHGESFGRAVWAGLKRVSLRDKLVLSRAYASDVVGCREAICLPELDRLLEVRNRLAHFKDSDTLVAEFSFLDFDEVLPVILSADDPELIKQLKSPSILAQAETVARIAKWVVKIERQFEKRHGIATHASREGEPEDEGQSGSAK
jgi:hypothetical protein